MNNKKELSLCQIITGFFEQQILVAYEYFFYSKKIYFFPKIELILNMIKENENLENFFMNKNKNKNKENIITLELINEMISNFKSNITFKKRFDDYKKMFDQLYKEYYKTEFYIGDPVLENQGEDIYKELIEEMNTNKIKGKEMHLLLNKITFMKLKDINNYREFIYFNLKKYFTEIRNKEFLEDLLNDTNDNKEGKKKKKKKKKNKNNSSNNNINININNISRSAKKDKFEPSFTNNNIINLNVILNNTSNNNNNKNMNSLQIINDGHKPKKYIPVTPSQMRFIPSKKSTLPSITISDRIKPKINSKKFKSINANKYYLNTESNYERIERQKKIFLDNVFKKHENLRQKLKK
jgi:hypothetical protein